MEKQTGLEGQGESSATCGSKSAVERLVSEPSWRQKAAEREARLAAIGWISIEDRLPEVGQEVTVLMIEGQIRQIVRANDYASGFKQVNCAGWECLSLAKMEHVVTHWRPEVHPRLPDSGPDNAPWRVR